METQVISPLDQKIKELSNNPSFAALDEAKKREIAQNAIQQETMAKLPVTRGDMGPIISEINQKNFQFSQRFENVEVIVDTVVDILKETLGITPAQITERVVAGHLRNKHQYLDAITQSAVAQGAENNPQFKENVEMAKVSIK